VKKGEWDVYLIKKFDSDTSLFIDLTDITGDAKLIVCKNEEPKSLE